MDTTVKAREDGNIHLSLVMAGAVTAGAFTGGVIDYMLTALAAWQDEYDREGDQVVPKPNVVIDTITGASAGSIAAALAVVSAREKRCTSVQQLIERNRTLATSSLQHFTWVKFGTKEKDLTSRIFSNTDVQTEAATSLLNSKFIEELIELVKDRLRRSSNEPWPGYFYDHLNILITLSNIKGIPIDIQFNGGKNTPVHRMFYHKAFAHFARKNRGEAGGVINFQLEDDGDVAMLLQCARASGAFPIGLSAQTLKGVPNDYIKENLKKIFGELDLSLELTTPTTEYTCVDGGMTNNEPLGEAINILRDNLEKHGSSIDDNQVILIDPFPSHVHEEPEPAANGNSLLDVVPQLLGVLRNQSMFKESSLHQLLDSNYRNNMHMIWPTRYEEQEDGQMLPVTNTLACGAMGGFSGFFCEDFREHDYWLGLKNSQNFINKYFSQPLAKAKDQGWPETAIERFKFEVKPGEWRIPIIPDYAAERESTSGEYAKITDHPKYPDFPKMHYVNEVVPLQSVIQERIRGLATAIGKEYALKSSQTKLPGSTPTKDGSKHTHRPAEKDKVYIKSGFLSRITSRFISRLPLERVFAWWLAPKIVNLIAKNLDDHKLLNDERLKGGR